MELIINSSQPSASVCSHGYTRPNPFVPWESKHAWHYPRQSAWLKISGSRCCGDYGLLFSTDKIEPGSGRVYRCFRQCLSSTTNETKPRVMNKLEGLCSVILALGMYTLFSRCVGSFHSAKEPIDHQTPGRILIAEEVRRHMEPSYSLYKSVVFFPISYLSFRDSLKALCCGFASAYSNAWLCMLYPLVEAIAISKPRQEFWSP